MQRRHRTPSHKCFCNDNKLIAINSLRPTNLTTGKCVITKLNAIKRQLIFLMLIGFDYKLSQEKRMKFPGGETNMNKYFGANMSIWRQLLKTSSGFYAFSFRHLTAKIDLQQFNVGEAFLRFSSYMQCGLCATIATTTGPQCFQKLMDKEIFQKIAVQEEGEEKLMLWKVDVYDNTLRHEAISAAKLAKGLFSARCIFGVLQSKHLLVKQIIAFNRSLFWNQLLCTSSKYFLHLIFDALLNACWWWFNLVHVSSLETRDFRFIRRY